MRGFPRFPGGLRTLSLHPIRFPAASRPYVPQLAYWWFRLTSAIRWYLRARTRYDVHSPFLSRFAREVYHDDRRYHVFGLVAQVRRYWRGRRELVQLHSLGASSRTTTRTHRTASSLVSTNAITRRSGELLFRVALWAQPARIIEFGTNAGISTLYLHGADTRTPLFTVEGNPEVAELARETFRRAGTSPALRPAVATFAQWLEQHPKAAAGRLLFFLDGDHRYAPTLAYVDHMLESCAEESVLVVADIHWSPEMERAWEQLKLRPRVTASVDTYHFGLLFLRSELNGPHLTLIPTRYKPWRVGFF